MTQKTVIIVNSVVKHSEGLKQDLRVVAKILSTETQPQFNLVFVQVKTALVVTQGSRVTEQITQAKINMIK